jgi:hypothetical protein
MTRIHGLLLTASVALATLGVTAPAHAATDGTSNTLMFAEMRSHLNPSARLDEWIRS